MDPPLTSKIVDESSKKAISEFAPPKEYRDKLFVRIGSLIGTYWDRLQSLPRRFPSRSRNFRDYP
jgi:hypothetical protein